MSAIWCVSFLALALGASLVPTTAAVAGPTSTPTGTPTATPTAAGAAPPPLPSPPPAAVAPPPAVPAPTETPIVAGPTPTATPTASGQSTPGFESESAQGSQGSATAGGSPLIVGPNVNISRLEGNHQEVAIAIHPTEPKNLFVLSNTEEGDATYTRPAALFGAWSHNGGISWTGDLIADENDTLIQGCCDPTVSWDEFGNLFIAYVDSEGGPTHVYRSTDGGENFSFIATLGGLTDQPTIATGEDSVWITYKQLGFPFQIVAHGAGVTGSGSTVTFGAAQAMPNSGDCNFGDIAIGPIGQVLVACQEISSNQNETTIRVALDDDGTGAGVFDPAVDVTTTNVGANDIIKAQPDRAIDAEAGLAYDRSGGDNDGRVYLAYTEEPINEDGSDDTDIFVRFSDDDGDSWSDPPVSVSGSGSSRSQFLPRIAMDQETGAIAVSWHDARNDNGSGPGSRKAGVNNDAQFFAAMSTDGGENFDIVQVSEGTSDENESEPPGICCTTFQLDYGDYTGLAFVGGHFYPAWADNSNSTGDNPDGATTMEIYTVRVLPEPDQLFALSSGIMALWGLSFLRMRNRGLERRLR